MTVWEVWKHRSINCSFFMLCYRLFTLCEWCFTNEIDSYFKFCHELQTSAKLMTVPMVLNTVSSVASLHVVYSFLFNLPENVELF
jgi:hypothetical protein